MKHHEIDLARVKPFGVELPVGADGEIDLHNFADFVGHTFKNGIVKLRWKSSEEGQLNIRWDRPKGEFALETLQEVLWTFGQVTDFRVDPRDPEMPASEDKTLKYFGLSSEGVGYRGIFVFHGGVKIEILANRTYVETQ